jgi:Family of unknown function (DUF6318)
VSRPGWLVSIVVSTLLLGGCSGDEPSASPPSEPPSTTSAASPPTPKPPSLPASARKPNKAGAVAFAYHFVDVLNYSAASGHLKELHEVSTSSCVSCRNVARGLSDVYAAGGSLRGGDLKVKGHSALRANASLWTVGLEVSTAPQIIKASSNASPRRVKGGSYSLTVDVMRHDAGWVIPRFERAR